MKHLLLLALLLPACAKQGSSTGPTAATNAIPTAAEVFAAHRQAVLVKGFKPVAMRMTGSASMGPMQMTIITESVPPNQMRVITTVPGAGELVHAFDGTIGWTTHPQTGTSLLTGSELKDFAASADATTSYDLRTLYPSASMAGTEEFAGEPAWRVDGTNHAGKAVTMWFSKASGLKLGSRRMEDGPAGEIEVVSTYSDRAWHGGVYVPMRMSQSMGPVVMEMTIDEVVVGDVEPFTAPDEVRALAAE